NSLVAAVSESADLDAAVARLAAEGIGVGPDPVWRAVRREAVAAERLLAATRQTVYELAAAGVVTDEQMEFERRSGRRRIMSGDDKPRLAIEGGEGVVDASAARERVSRGLRGAFPDDEELADTLARAIARDLAPSLRYEEALNRDRRDAAAHRVASVMTAVGAGTVIVREGEPLTRRDHEMVLSEAAEFHAGRSLASHAARLGGVIAVVAAVTAALAVAMMRLEPDSLGTARSVLFAGFLDLLVVAAARGQVVVGLGAMLAPLALVGIVFALTVSPLFATLNAVALGVLTALAAGPQYAVPLALVSGAVAASHAAARARRRSELLRAGAVAGIVQLVVIVGMTLASGVEHAPVLLERGGWALLNGFGCGLLSLGLLPFAEGALGVTTDISLLELSDQNHPALRRLLIEAPGTYHHSLIVGNLSEAAALEVGANALLARVASYYHDLGKVDRPEYFIENGTPGRSRHEGLSPAMSTLIIVSHVRDGVALARQYRLPRAITDVIAQHHGTSVVEYFYRTAVEGSEEGTVDEQLFRYAGPKPRTREAAIVLVADTVEAASRALEEPTSARLTKLVNDLTMKRLMDGQFDGSGLTLSDLRAVCDSVVKVLASMFHTRVQYPAAPSGPSGPRLSGTAP
ncbi:MAG: HD family phosphohydrolase, partial [Planctomycetota bacterium]